MDNVFWRGGGGGRAGWRGDTLGLEGIAYCKTVG